MKAGIITITNGENYGNRLQNYAVQEALKDCGFKPETIHKTTNVFDGENPRYIAKLKLKAMLHRGMGKEEERRLNFRRFTKKYIKKSRYKIDKEVPEKLDGAYDFFIAGSDQVWNPYLSYCTPANFLTFTSSDKKIAFSPSFGVSNLPENETGKIAQWLQDFRLLSVREETGARLICKLCRRKAQVLSDPTLYLTAKQWRKVEKKVLVRKGGYLLTYFLGECTEDYRRQIREYARREKLDIFALQTNEHYAIAPDEFLYLIDHAALVCTDSFHGTVFSLIFKTDFVVFERKESFADMGSRLDTLLHRFSMEHRRLEAVKEEELLHTDFSETDRIIGEEREKTRKFLWQIDRGKTYV